MVDFFIRRPIFATVSALLMLLIGGICAVRLPIAQYPQVAPPQVQVTTTYTGADALSVARTVTTPIEQQINGTKGMIYYNSDSTSNGVSNIVATFDVGYSQDMAAVDIQNRVQTAQAQLPPEVKQYGVSIKKTSTDMVCVVNLISPDGRYDANFLDNYGQIYVADVLKRIDGRQRRQRARAQVRDADLDRPRPPGQHEDRPDRGDPGDPAGERPGGRRQDRRPAGPDRAGLRAADHAQGAAGEGEPSSRRSSSAAATTARSSASRTSPASSCRRRTTSRPATSTASRPAAS